ncbi:ABC transporter permease [Actinomadura scrupuli]|uniref:ABC transporter permease n=1 Tax=Actinomadura scrupuli TaxID=559629 RepID=UPI003D95A68A
MHAFTRIVAVEFKLRMREKMTPFFTIALPLGLLFAFGLLPGADRPDEHLGGQSGAEYIAAIAMGVTIAVLGLMMLPGVLADYRDKGVLRRMRATPVRPAFLLLAQVVINAVAALVAIVVLIVVGSLALGTPVPQRPAAFAQAAALTVASMFALGLLVAAVAPDARAATGIAMLTFFPSMFLAGVYVPREQLPPVLRDIGDLTPLGAGLRAMRDAWTGAALQPAHLAIMAGYAVVAGLAAARLFRWE